MCILADGLRTDEAKILLTAKLLVMERGWCKGTFHGAHGEVCVLGAIRLAWLSLGSHFEGACSVFRDANGIVNIAEWNDRWLRTKPSVMRAFDKAIAHAERLAA